MKNDDLVIQTILTTAKTLFQQFGFNKTTMEDIASAAGKGKSTLYYYFKNKDAIFNEVIRLEMDDLFRTVQEAVDFQHDTIGKLKNYMVTKVTIVHQQVNLYRFTIEQDVKQVQINNQFTKLRERYDLKEKKLLAGILSHGVDAGVFSISNKDEIDLLAEILVTCIRGIERDIVTQKKYATLADKADFLTQILAKGLA